MVFSSHVFLFFFLPVVLACNYLLPFRSLSAVLTLLSYLFYGWSNPAWVLLMLAGSYIDFFCGLGLVHFGGGSLAGKDLPALPKGGPRTRGQRICLAASLLSNIGILAFFKYYDFGVVNLEAAARAAGLGSIGLPVLNVALPVGVSFYTFQSMSYAIDVYRGVARPLKNPVDFQLFVSLFPQLIAGPIVRYQTVAEQIRHRTFDLHKFTRGVAFFSLGLGKKILLANPMGHVADAAFNAGTLPWHDAWYGVVAYAFQIYFDFSGYSDMAVGLGLMLGFAFMKNFDDPYLAESITDFWRRWHISLSTWLRDYLYIPLGGNRSGAKRTYANLMTVMLVGGLWHGASWNFVIWGAIQGIFLAAERLQGEDSAWRRLPAPFRIAATFLVTCLAWVFFRAETLPQAVTYLRSLAGLVEVPAGALAVAASIYTPYHVAIAVSCAIVVWTLPQVWDFTRRLTPLKAAACVAVLLASIVVLWTQTTNPFLYYQF